MLFTTGDHPRFTNRPAALTDDRDGDARWEPHTDRSVAVLNAVDPQTIPTCSCGRSEAPNHADLCGNQLEQRIDGEGHGISEHHEGFAGDEVLWHAKHRGAVERLHSNRPDWPGRTGPERKPWPAFCLSSPSHDTDGAHGKSYPRVKGGMHCRHQVIEMFDVATRHEEDSKIGQGPTQLFENRADDFASSAARVDVDTHRSGKRALHRWPSHVQTASRRRDSANRGQQRVRNNADRPLVQAALGDHGAVVLHGEVCPDEAIVELSWLDLERLDIASHRL